MSDSEAAKNVNFQISNEFDQYKTPSLHKACLDGNKQKVFEILQNDKGEIELTDRWGQTALFYTVFGDHPDLMELLLKHGAKVDAVDYKKRTALHYASYLGPPACVKILLHHYNHKIKRPNAWLIEDVYQSTPIHYAAINSQSKCLNLLLKLAHPSMLDILDKKKRSALHWAATCSLEKNVKLLIKYGANVLISDETGKTPLHWAVVSKAEGAKSCIQTILDASPSSANWQDFRGMAAIHLAVIEPSKDIAASLDLLSSKKCDFNLKDNNFHTAMHWTCSRGMTSVVNKLLEYEADIGSLDVEGATPLHYAALHNHCETVHLLVKKMNIKFDKANDGKTPLLWASLVGADQSLTVMVQYGASLLESDHRGHMALHLAAGAGHTSTVALLLRLGASVNETNGNHETPLICAAKGGHKKIVKQLIKANASINHRDNEGRCILHYAVINGHIHLTQVLINCGLSLNIKDYYGQTPLHIATIHGWLEIMCLLLNNSADVNMLDNQGYSCLHYAAQRKVTVIEVLSLGNAYPNFLTFPEKHTPLDLAIICKKVENIQTLIGAGALTFNDIKEASAIAIQAFFRGYMTRKNLSSVFKNTLGNKNKSKEFVENSTKSLKTPEEIQSMNTINETRNIVNEDVFAEASNCLQSFQKQFQSRNKDEQTKKSKGQIKWENLLSTATIKLVKKSN